MAKGRRIGLALGAIAALVLIAAAWLTYRWADRTVNYLPKQMLAQAAPGWMDAFRKVNRLPQLAGLDLPRTTESDGSAAFYAAARKWHLGRVRSGPAPAADSELWRSVSADPDLDRVVAAARTRGWDAISMAFPHGDSASLFFTPPPFSSIRIALHGLHVRAQQRLARRDLNGAGTDLGALVGLGGQMLRHEPTLSGMTAGGQAIRLAIPSYVELARVTRDTATTARLQLLQAWADYQPSLGTNPILFLAAPDSACAMAADSTLVLGWRQFMLYAFVTAHLNRPRAILFGVPQAVLDTLALLTRDPNADLARLARVAVRALERANRSSVLQRWRSARESTRMMPM